MRKRTRLTRLAVMAGACVALGLSASQLLESRAEARGPIFLCGPDYLWVCSGPGGPDVLFGGTVCDKALFERQTGLTCVPFTW
jgi:hypothetical protein